MIMVETILGIVIGGLITFFVSWYYYQKSAKELQEESRKLRKTVNSLARWLQYTGLSKDEFIFDDEGNITGLVITASATAEIKTQAFANAEVISKNEKEEK